MSGNHHISSLKLLITVGLALFILTLLTVFLAQQQLPNPYNIIVALIIAFFKAFLVIAFFMNLYWDSKFNTYVIVSGFMFLVVFIALTLMDTLLRDNPQPSF